MGIDNPSINDVHEDSTIGNDGKVCYTFIFPDGATWVVNGPDEYGRYDVVAPNGEEICGVTSDGNWIDAGGDPRFVPGFPEVLNRILKRKNSISIGIKNSLLQTLEGNVCIQTIKVEEKEYLYSTWWDLGSQLKEDDVSLEEIWKICKSIDSEIEEFTFVKKVLGKWHDCGKRLKEHGFSVEKIWEICKSMDPEINYTDFFHIATNSWGFVGMDLKSLQDSLGESYNNEQVRGIDF